MRKAGSMELPDVLEGDNCDYNKRHEEFGETVRRAAASDHDFQRDCMLAAAALVGCHTYDDMARAVHKAPFGSWIRSDPEAIQRFWNSLYQEMADATRRPLMAIGIKDG